jgi:hypothetical protein
MGSSQYCFNFLQVLLEVAKIGQMVDDLTPDFLTATAKEYVLEANSTLKQTCQHSHYYCAPKLEEIKSYLDLDFFAMKL